MCCTNRTPYYSLAQTETRNCSCYKNVREIQELKIVVNKNSMVEDKPFPYLFVTMSSCSPLVPLATHDVIRKSGTRAEAVDFI